MHWSADWLRINGFQAKHRWIFDYYKHLNPLNLLNITLYTKNFHNSNHTTQHLLGKERISQHWSADWWRINGFSGKASMNIWWCPNTSIHLFRQNNQARRCHSRFHFCSSYLDRSIKLDVVLGRYTLLAYIRLWNFTMV